MCSCCNTAKAACRQSVLKMIPAFLYSNKAIYVTITNITYNYRNNAFQCAYLYAYFKHKSIPKIESILSVTQWNEGFGGFKTLRRILNCKLCMSCNF